MAEVIQLFESSGTAMESVTLSKDDQFEKQDLVEKMNFKNHLLSTLRAEPIENGFSHPAQEIIDLALRDNKNKAISWIQALFLECLPTNTFFAVGILRCVGRLDKRIIDPWGFIMAIGALTRPDVEVREAAVRALEMWEDPSKTYLLKAHIEEVPWLAEYISRVIQGLER